MERGDVAEVIEVATSQLSEHSKQAEYSPQMSAKKWREFVVKHRICTSYHRGYSRR